MNFYELMLFLFLVVIKYLTFGICYTLGFVSSMKWSDRIDLLTPRKILFSLFLFPIEIARTIYYIFIRKPL
jgi:hypothetical protein